MKVECPQGRQGRTAVRISRDDLQLPSREKVTQGLTSIEAGGLVPEELDGGEDLLEVVVLHQVVEAGVGVEVGEEDGHGEDLVREVLARLDGLLVLADPRDERGKRQEKKERAKGRHGAFSRFGRCGEKGRGEISGLEFCCHFIFQACFLRPLSLVLELTASSITHGIELLAQVFSSSFHSLFTFLQHPEVVTFRYCL